MHTILEWAESVHNTLCVYVWKTHIECSMSADLIYCFQNTQWINFPVEPGCYLGLFAKKKLLPRCQVRLVLLNLFPSLAGF